MAEVVEVISETVVVEVVVEKTLTVEVEVPGFQGRKGDKGDPGQGALDLPLAITNPQTGDVLEFDESLQTAGAWKNVPKHTITDAGFY